MSRHHRDRSWAPDPEPLPAGTGVIDDHTHMASVVPFAQEMDRQARERGQDPVPVRTVDQQLARARAVGVVGAIDVGCELPHCRRLWIWPWPILGWFTRLWPSIPMRPFCTAIEGCRDRMDCH